MRRLLLPFLIVVLLLLLPACGGLPLPEGVRDAGAVRVRGAEAGRIVIVPPGPQPGATASELVRGYLNALSVSPEDDHAVAREFLAPGVDLVPGDAVVYDLPSQSLVVDNDDPSLVRARFDAVARIRPDGSYTPEDGPQVDDYRVTRVEGELRLSKVPEGLRLQVTDVERTFTAYDVHHLARTAGGDAGARLVPDRVFLLVTAEPGQALVDAVLRGPTGRLGVAAQTAATEGTRARVRDDGGVAVVDLSRQVRDLDARARQRLSAQLVWTLVPTYSAVRVLVEGEPLEVAGVDEEQDREDWREYDPAVLGADAPLLFLAERRLRRLDRAITESDVTDGRLPVDGAALSPTTGQLAVRTRLSTGVHEVRTGPLGGPFSEPLVEEPDLTSLSWGPGDQGLWVLQNGKRRPVVRLVPGPEAADRRPRLVAYEQPPGGGTLTALRVSRDGARIALVFGGRLHVGLVDARGADLRITGIIRVSREFDGVSDVAWRNGTLLVALGSFEQDDAVIAAEVAVDGSSFDVVQRPAGGRLREVAAAPRNPLVVSAEVEGRVELFRDNGTLFAELQQPGGSPFYPG